MKIRSETRLHHSIDKVFEAYRDRMSEVAAFLPDIESIQVLSRVEEDGRVVLHNEWRGDVEIPKVASKFLKPEHLRWDDYATWQTDTRSCSWRIETRVFNDGFSCSGTTKLTEDGDGTRIVLDGDLKIQLQGVPGVPGFLGKRLAPQIEKFVVALIAPNLEKTNEAIGRYLDSQG